MLAHSPLSRFPRGLFVWIVVEGASASTIHFISTRKALCTNEVAKDLSTQRRRYSSIFKPSNRITCFPGWVIRRNFNFFFPLLTIFSSALQTQHLQL